MIIRNEDVSAVCMDIPDGHRHLRTTVVLQDGTELTFQEATVASIVRAYTTIKTDPRKASVKLKGQVIPVRKPGYAEWQLIEEAS